MNYEIHNGLMLMFNGHQAVVREPHPVSLDRTLTADDRTVIMALSGELKIDNYTTDRIPYDLLVEGDKTYFVIDKVPIKSIDDVQNPRIYDAITWEIIWAEKVLKLRQDSLKLQGNKP